VVKGETHEFPVRRKNYIICKTFRRILATGASWAIAITKRIPKKNGEYGRLTYSQIEHTGIRADERFLVIL